MYPSPMKTLPSSMIMCLLVLSVLSCRQSETRKTLLPEGVRLQPGDVVFRRGSGLTSRMVLWLDGDGRYSHVGIVVDSAGVPMVVHAVPDEPDYQGDVDRVKMELPEVFFSQNRTSVGAVMRPYDEAAGKKAASEAWKIYRRGVAFDHDYDETDTTKMHCTELVLFAYAKAHYPLVKGKPRTMQFAGRKFTCSLPSNIYGSEKLKRVLVF